MRILNNCRNTLLTTVVVIARQFWGNRSPACPNAARFDLIVRHAEADTSQPTVPLTVVDSKEGSYCSDAARRKVHAIFASHTTRAR
jgi:hypothetical protein